MRRAGSWWSSGALDEAQSIWGAAAEAGDTEAAFHLGVLLVQRRDLAGAETWWRRAAEAGNVAAEVDALVKLIDRLPRLVRRREGATDRHDTRAQPPEYVPTGYVHALPHASLTSAWPADPV
jgi:TPR repeat protein